MSESTVWEIRNEKLKELFVGVSDKPLQEIKDRWARSLPSPIAHWDPSAHPLVYAPLAPSIPRSDAVDFAFCYVKALASSDWRVLSQPGWEM